MRRRQYAAVTLAMPMLLAACIAPGRTGPPAASDVATCPVDLLDQRGDGEEPVAVTFWYNEIAEPESAIVELVARYNESQDRVVVTAHNQGQELYEKYESAIGTSGLPDVAEIYDDKTLAAVGSETLLPAQACMEEAGFDVDDIDPVIRSYYTVNGVYWPGYVGPNEPVLYLNASHFERAGLDPDDPIDTLDELYAAAKTLKAAGVSDKPLSVADGGPVLDWIAAAGETVVDNNNGRDATPTESTFDNPATRAVYTWLAKLRDEGLILTGPWPDHLLALSSQTSSMTVDVTGTATSIEAFLAGGEGDIVPGVGPFPTIDAADAGGGPSCCAFYLVNQSEPVVQAAAWDFMEFMLQGDQGAAWVARSSYLPFQLSVDEHPLVTALLGGDSLTGRTLRLGRDQLAARDPSHPRPLLHFEFNDAIARSAEALLTGASVDAAIDQGDQAINDAIEIYYGSST